MATLRSLLSILFIGLGTRNAYGLVAFQPGPIELVFILFLLILVILSPIVALVLIKAKTKLKRRLLGICTLVCIFTGVLALGSGILGADVYPIFFGLGYIAVGLFSRMVHLRTRRRVS